MNLPNRLTVARLALAAIFVGCMSVRFPFNYTLALGVFVAAALTDYLDGALARRWQLITDFGKLMDPLADKILTAAAFICLVAIDGLPAWVVIVVVSREFLITGLRLLAGAKGVVLPAERLGKHKTAWQMVAILFFLTMLALGEWLRPPGRWFRPVWFYGGSALVAIMAFLTIYSGLAYLWKNRSLIAAA